VGSPLLVALDLDGSAQEGVHINSVPRSISIPAGQASADVVITSMAGWDGAQTRMALLRLVAQSGYQLGNPHEATIYASNTASQAAGAGFDRWVSAASAGEFDSIHDLLQAGRADRLGDYLRAYAFGDAAPEPNALPGISLRIVGNRPELTTRLQSDLPDLRWQVQDSADATGWNDVGAEFSEQITRSGMRFLGPPLDAANPAKLYRLNFDLETSSGLETGVASLSGASRYGIRGASAWMIDPASGALTGDGGAPGAPNRLIVEVKAPTVLDFEMAVAGGNGSDSLAFSIDGMEVAQTNGAKVRVDRTLSPIGTTILMWELRRGTGSGKAVITDNPTPESDPRQPSGPPSEGRAPRR
jgi:hypothetical protein